jgi:ribosomal protein S18 acetylase RimI-like enzyme
VSASPPTLRDATAADAEPIATLFLAARRTAMPWLATPRSDDDTRRWIATVLLRDFRARVAVVGNAVAGFAVVADGWLDHLYVAPACQGVGVGSLLLDDAKRSAGAALRRHVFQRNQRARDFYCRRGFIEPGFSDGAGNMEREPDLVMRWTAAA